MVTLVGTVITVKNDKYCMRISELLESEKLDEITRPDINVARAKLKNAGYDEIGSGCFANVLHKPSSNTVIKLFRASREQPYIRFVELAQSTNNVHFPIFRGKVMKVTERYYAVRMEKLSPFKVNNRSEYDRRILDDYITDTINGFVDDDVKKEYEELCAKQPGLDEAMKKLFELADKLNTTSFDLGTTENIMLRGKTWVITDPFFG